MGARLTAICAVVAATSSILLAAPANAATTSCYVLPAATPAVSDVTLCVGADVVVSPAPTIEREQCGGFGSCMTYYVSYGVSGHAAADVTFCYTSGGVQSCAVADLPSGPIDVVRPGRMCVGYDLRGGFPCPNGGPIEFG